MNIRQRLLEIVTLLAGSVTAGFVIAVLQHYVTFGIRGYGFGSDAFVLACFEGGFLGVLFGIPTGLVVYYVALRGHATAKQVLIITLGSLAVGCGGGMIFGWPFAFATPVLTVWIAGFVGAARGS